MSKERIKKIKERMDWLSMELQHEAYWDGYTTNGFREELKKLIKELKELEKEIENK